MQRTPQRVTAHRVRRGNILLGALVCLLVVTLTVAAVVRLTVVNARQVHGHVRTAQAFWLAEAGLDRAAARIRRSPEYRGERWRVDADGSSHSSVGARGAIIEITVEPVDGRAEHYRVRVAAEYPAESARRARVTREAVMGDADPPGTERKIGFEERNR